MKTGKTKAESNPVEVDRVDSKGQPYEPTPVEISNAYQACMELRTITRALKSFSVEVNGDSQLGWDEQRELDTIALFLELCESKLASALDGVTFNLGLQSEDLPEASHRLWR